MVRAMRLICLLCCSILLYCSVASAASFQELLSRAESGDFNAQSYVGHSFLVGKNGVKDLTKARYWYNRILQEPGADAKLIAHSNLMLGMLYQSGKGGKKCLKTALECFKKAAAQGYTDAHLTIGLMYAKGEGVKQDYQKALDWWQMAADKGHPSAPRCIDKLSKQMTTLAKK